MFLAMPRDKDMLATFVHALAFFPCNSPRQGHVGNVRSCLGFSRTCWQRSFMPWLIFLAIPRDKDILATFVHALAYFPCNSPRQGHLGNVRSCLGFFSLQFPATRTCWQRSFMPWGFFSLQFPATRTCWQRSFMP
jgi:hypothetical protein